MRPSCFVHAHAVMACSHRMSGIYAVSAHLCATSRCEVSTDFSGDSHSNPKSSHFLSIPGCGSNLQGLSGDGRGWIPFRMSAVGDQAFPEHLIPLVRAHPAEFAPVQ